MDLNVLLGATSIVGMGAGAWALVLYRKNGNGNGHHAPEPAPAPIVVQGLAELPGQIERGLMPIFERSFTRFIEAAPRPDIRMAEVVQIASESRSWTVQLATSLDRITDRLEAILQMGPPGPPPELVADLERIAVQISERLESVARLVQTPERPPITELPQITELVRGLDELPARIGEALAARIRAPRFSASSGNATSSSGGGNGVSEAGGDGGEPPVRRAPPAFLPRLPLAANPAVPQIPAPYVPGSVFVPAGAVSNLLALIQQQLSPNCPGTAVEFLIAADTTNAGSILVGGASSLGGPLTQDNYAYELTPTSPPRIYRSTYPGGNTPVGELQVLAPAGGYLHVEVQS